MSTGDTTTYHEERCHDPVDEHAEGDILPDASVREDAVQNLVLHFAENRIHHHQQPDRWNRSSADLRRERKGWTRRRTYRDGHIRKLALLQRRPDFRHEIAQQDPEDHGEEDPEGQEAVEPAE